MSESSSEVVVAASSPVACTRCGTELAPSALACPACRALVHSALLKQLAAEAERASGEDRLADARTAWTRALGLLPADAAQHRAIEERVAELTRRIEATPRSARDASSAGGAWWKRAGASAVAVVLLLAGKLKFLLLGLTKASTFFSMFAFFGVYWSAFGWPLALGLVVSIYIHEMGHVAMIRRLGLSAGAPFFIPGVGALVRLRQHVSDPVTDARIGLAGPEWGLGAALGAYLAFVATDRPVWAAIAQLGAFVNLFNLIPIWQLDGSRAFHALGRWQRWGVAIAIAVAYTISGQKLLLLVAAVAVWRALQRPEHGGDRRTFLTFLVLLAGLVWLAGTKVV